MHVLFSVPLGTLFFFPLFTPVSLAEDHSPVASPPIPKPAKNSVAAPTSPSRSATPQPAPISIDLVLDSELPQKVTLIEPVEFRIANGKGKVDLISRKGSTLSVKYLDSKKDVQFTQTSLLKDVAFERQRLAQVKTKQSDPEARETPRNLNAEKVYKAEELIGLTRERMLSLMGQPLSVRSGSHSTDGGFKIYSYSKEKGKETYFTIWDDEGTIHDGMYKGAYFFKK